MNPEIIKPIHHHPAQKDLNLQIRIGDPVYILGPTGSGKTFGVSLAAKDNELPFYKKLIGAQMTESALMGYMDAHGKYVPGIAYKPFTEGGILLLDEIDNGNSNTNLVVNGLADREINFPIGMHVAHPKFRLVATANTMGSGANLHYVGRNRQDMALTSRFNYLEWPYDIEFEKEIVYQTYLDSGGSTETQQYKLFWNVYDDFLRMRDAIDAMNINHILSPRNAIYLARQVANGVDPKIILHAVMRRGIEKETMKSLMLRAKEMKSKIFDNNGELLSKKQTDVKKANEVVKKALGEKLPSVSETTIDLEDTSKDNPFLKDE